MSSRIGRKKRVEQQYIEEARGVSTIFPSGELVPHERPDFLLRTDVGSVGIELTELCREAPRAEAGRLAKIPKRAQQRYGRAEDADPVDVSIAFWRAEEIGMNDLSNSLADFVYRNRRTRGSEFKEALPGGYCHIGIHDPIEADGRWHGVRAFDTILASREFLQACITEKNERLPVYLLSAARVWLLIINDRFLGPGEVYARLDHVAQWKFNFDFDKVLLFSREPGGGGEVMELQRC
jgi:hypothetical protein